MSDRFDSQEFHELMMDYRASLLSPAFAYGRVLKFIRSTPKQREERPIVKRDEKQEAAWFEREIPASASADFIAGLEFAGEIVLDDQLHPSGRVFGDYVAHNGALQSAHAAIERATALAKSRAPSPSVEQPQQVEPGWQPIETAPKDGTHILACRAQPLGLYSPQTIVWAAYHPNASGEVCWRTSATCGNKANHVTHWMPLPAAPKEPKP